MLGQQRGSEVVEYLLTSSLQDRLLEDLTLGLVRSLAPGAVNDPTVSFLVVAT